MTDLSAKAKALHARGLRVRRQRAAEMCAKIRNLKGQGLKPAQIATELGIKPRSVYHYLRVLKNEAHQLNGTQK